MPANTVLDVARLERDIASLSGQPSPLNVQGISRDFGNAALGTWTLGLEQSLGSVTASANYIGTTAWKLARVSFPNAYPGAISGFARFTQFNAAGVPVGGFGTESIVTPTSHSNYQALQLSVTGPTGHGGPGIQASYTYSKSIDDTSSVGGTSATSTVGAIAQAAPQSPFDTHAERGPSTFDQTHSFSLSLAQELPFQRLTFLNEVNKKATEGWQPISVSSISSGTPSNTILGSGFGLINRTAGSSRQIQFSLKLAY